jgi:N4-gp56 family major capsid protein
MATTSFNTSHALTQKLWGKKAFKDSVKETLYGKLVGSSDRSIIQMKDDLQKSPGDRIRFRLRALPVGLGVDGDATLEGQEEGLSYSNFDLGIDMKRHAHKVDLGMNQQRVDFNLRDDAKEAQAEWWKEYIDTMMFEYLSGAATLSYHGGATFGNNTSVAPSANRITYPGTVTAKNTMTATDTMTLTMIDQCVEMAKLASPTMRKGKFGGTSKYVMVLHPYQVFDLRTNATAGQWLDIQKAAMQGGKVSDNPIYSEALGEYNGVILVENTRVPTFTDYGAGGNIPASRALFLGAQAGVCGFGRETKGATRMKWVEKKFDYDQKWGVSAGLIWGMQKTRFDGEDFGVIAVDTAATSHS